MLYYYTVLSNYCVLVLFYGPVIPPAGVSRPCRRRTLVDLQRVAKLNHVLPDLLFFTDERSLAMITVTRSQRCAPVAIAYPAHPVSRARMAKTSSAGRYDVAHCSKLYECLQCRQAAGSPGRDITVTDCILGFTPFTVKCGGEAPAGITFQMGTGEPRNVSVITGHLTRRLRPVLFRLSVRPILRNFRIQHQILGAEVPTYLDDLIVAAYDLAAETLRVISQPIEELAHIGVNTKSARTKVVDPRNRVPTGRRAAALAAAGMTVAEEGGCVVVGTPIGLDQFVQYNAVKVIKNGGRQTGSPTCTKARQASDSTVLIAATSRAFNPYFLEPVMCATYRGFPIMEDYGYWRS